MPGPIVQPLQNRISSSRVSMQARLGLLDGLRELGRSFAHHDVARDQILLDARDLQHAAADAGTGRRRGRAGASKSPGSTASRSTARAVSNSRSSVNVRTSSTSAPRSGDAASRFLAMHGPMKTMRSSPPCCSRRSRAIAIIGDTIGARLDVSPG